MKITKRNFFAKELRESKYQLRVVPSFKKYNRAAMKKKLQKEFYEAT